MLQAVAFAALAAVPATLAQTAAAPGPASMTVKFEECLTKLGTGGTHSLLDIVEGAFTTEVNQGEASVLEDLLMDTSEQTMSILSGFDAEDEGYTLMMPTNLATNYTGQGAEKVDILELYDINPNATTPAEADMIIKAHLIKGTILYEAIQEETQDGEDYVRESLLPGWEWTFTWINGTDDGGFVALKDTWNVTGSPDGTIPIQPDKRNEPDCPNRVYGIEFIATPDLIADTVPAVAPAPEPEPATGDAPTTARGANDPLFPQDPTPPPSAPFTGEPTPGGTDPAAADGIHSRGLLAASVAGAVVLAAAML